MKIPSKNLVFQGESAKSAKKSHDKIVAFDLGLIVQVSSYSAFAFFLLTPSEKREVRKERMPRPGTANAT